MRILIINQPGISRERARTLSNLLQKLYTELTHVVLDYINKQNHIDENKNKMITKN